MVIYEVNLDVDNAVAEEFALWLPGHINELLCINGFISAVWLQEEGGAPGRVGWTVHYRLSDRESLEAYFRDHADRMRHDGLTRFPGGFKAHRRIFELQEEFNSISHT